MQTVQLNQPSESFLNEIKLLVGSNGWKSVEDMPRYFDDPRGRFEGFGTIIVLPNSTEQVSLIVSFAMQKRWVLFHIVGALELSLGNYQLILKMLLFYH
jgi:hypothetical protein